MGREGRSSITWWKWKDGLELASQALLRYPALSAAAGPPCQSPTAAPSPPRCIRHRRRFGGDARHAPQAGLRAHLVAESLCALTKNREASIVLASLFLAGAEGLEPSARGFGVDVGKHTRERGKGRCHPILAASHKTGGAGLVLRPQKEGRGRLIPATSRFCTPPPRPAWRPGWA